MAVRKVKGSWWVDFQIHGERHRKRSPENSKMGADAYESFLRREFAQHGSLKHLETINIQRENDALQTFQAFALKWLGSYVRTNNKPSEQYSKGRVFNAELIPAFGHMKLGEIRTSAIEAFKAKNLQRGLSPKTINNQLSMLHKCLATAVEWEELDLVPRVKFLKTTPPPFRFLSEIETFALLEALQEQEPLWRNMALLALKTGLRFSELVALSWEDIDLERRTLCVRHGAVKGHVGTPKNGRVRHIPLTGELVTMLRGQYPKSGLVFTCNDKMVYYDAARRHLRKACRTANIKLMSWHVLRHTFASHLASKGAALKAIQDLLGHTTLTMTLRYAHLSPEVLRDTINLLEPEKMSAGRQPLPEFERNDIMKIVAESLELR